MTPFVSSYLFVIVALAEINCDLTHTNVYVWLSAV